MRAAFRLLSWLTVAAFLTDQCQAASTAHQSGVREVSHEDIRDAVLSLINIYRENDDKLQRHEARERQLGEQLKKSFAQVDRKQGIEESNMVTVLNTLNRINLRLEILENATNKGLPCKESSTSNNDNGRAELFQKLNSLEQSIKNNEYLLQSMEQRINQKLDILAQNVLQTQSTVVSEQQELKQFLAVQNQRNTDLSPLLDSKLMEIRPHLEKIDKIVELQSKSVQHTTSLLDMTKSAGATGVTRIDTVGNSSNREIVDMRLAIERDVGLLKEKIAHVEDILVEKQQIIRDEISKSAKGNEDLRENMVKSYDQLLVEIRGFSRMDKVLVQTADNVLDAKRRVEYGTHQILVEVGDLIKSSSKDTNEIINKRFDLISSEIVSNQDGAMKNLSLKIETEISTVWRQIGIMYQTLTNSAEALNKLQQQTEVYVNGSLTTMDNMEGKVGQITHRMSEVDDNLNYLLGRLSLVTQEFNQIKSGLGEALDNIRSSFKTVQDKVKDSGPGPNPIEDDSSTPDSQLLKTKYIVS